jgi:biopolymer transport protein TolR
VVSITAAGEYYLSLGATGDDRQSTSLEGVGEQVAKIVSANPEIQVLVEGDTSADWGAMIQLLTTLQAAGVANPNFITKPLESL